MENELENFDLVRITEEFLCKQDLGVGIGNFARILYGNKIEKKINNVRKRYASYEVQSEIPVLLIDDTVFGSASRGFLVTNHALYYHLYPVANGLPVKSSIKLSEIKTIKIECLKKTANLMVNGERVAHLSAFSQKWPGILEANVLNELFKIYMEYLHPGTQEGTQGDGSPLSNIVHGSENQSTR